MRPQIFQDQLEHVVSPCCLFAGYARFDARFELFVPAASFVLVYTSK
jgi:hypothetical protein